MAALHYEEIEHHPERISLLIKNRFENKNPGTAVNVLSNSKKDILMESVASNSTY